MRVEDKHIEQNMANPKTNKHEKISNNNNQPNNITTSKTNNNYKENYTQKKAKKINDHRKTMKEKRLSRCTKAIIAPAPEKENKKENPSTYSDVRYLSSSTPYVTEKLSLTPIFVT